VPRDIKDRRIGTGTRRIPGALRVTSHDPHHDTTRIRPRPTDRVAKFPGAHRPVTKASVRPANKLRQHMRWHSRPRTPLPRRSPNSSEGKPTAEEAER